MGPITRRGALFAMGAAVVGGCSAPSRSSEDTRSARESSTARTTETAESSTARTEASGKDPREGGSDWPMAHAEPANSGFNPVEGIPSDPDQQWQSTRLGTGDVVTAPTVADGIAYVGVQTHLYAVGMDDGRIRWEREVREQPLNYFSPVVHRGTVYAVSRADSAGKLHAFDVETGEKRWGVGLPAASSPIVAGGTLLLRTRRETTEHVRAIDPESGDRRWRTGIGDGVTFSRNVGTVPSVSDGTVYVIGHGAYGPDGGRGARLYALSAADGTERWRFDVGSAVRSSGQAVRGGTVYFGTDEGTVHAVGTSGTERWRVGVTDTVRTMPAVDREAVYVGDFGTLHSLQRSDGSERWQTSVEALYTDLAATRNTVYTGGPSLQGIRKSDGAKRWQFDLRNMYSSAFGSPTVIEGAVVTVSCLKKKSRRNYKNYLHLLTESSSG